MIVRPYHDGDIGHVCELLADLQDLHARKDPIAITRPKAWFNEVRHFIDKLRAVGRRDGAVLVADDGGKAVGVIIGWTCLVDDPDDEHYPHKYGFVSDLSVDAARHGQGIGKLLMAAMEGHFRAKGCAWLHLNYMSTNDGAAAFYDRHGYVPIAVRVAKRL